MKHLTLLLIILVVSFGLRAQLSKNSIYMGRDIYGNKDKTECDKPKVLVSPASASGQCLCTIQDVVNNGFTVGFGGGNFGRIYMYEDYSQPGNFAVYEGDGPSIWFDYGTGSIKIVDIGYDPIAPLANGYVHLADHNGRQTIKLDGDTARITLADPTSTHISRLTSGHLTFDHDNQMPDDDGRLAINPIKADTTIFGKIDTGVILTYTVPFSVGSFGTYTVSGWAIGHIGMNIDINIQWFDPSGIFRIYFVNTIFSPNYISETFINIPVQAGTTIIIRTSIPATIPPFSYDIGATITRVHKG